MIGYADTSALVKLYIDEQHSAETEAFAVQCMPLAVSRIAWVETHAALARRARESPVDATAIDVARRAFVQSWPDLFVMELTQSVVERAGEFADAFALRAYDAVQLATAHELRVRGGSPIEFACFDVRLNRAARLLGLGTPFVQA